MSKIYNENVELEQSQFNPEWYIISNAGKTTGIFVTEQMLRDMLKDVENGNSELK